jgi:hypothetical protein
MNAHAADADDDDTMSTKKRDGEGFFNYLCKQASLLDVGGRGFS